MRLAIVWTILRKELVESLRIGARSCASSWSRSFSYPLFALAMSKLVGFEAAAREARPSRIAVWGELTEDLQTRLSAAGKIELAPWAGAPPRCARGSSPGRSAAGGAGARAGRGRGAAPRGRAAEVDRAGEPRARRGARRGERARSRRGARPVAIAGGRARARREGRRGDLLRLGPRRLGHGGGRASRARSGAPAGPSSRIERWSAACPRGSRARSTSCRATSRWTAARSARSSAR